MSKSNERVPVFGQPVFVITENSLEEKIGIIGERGMLTGLTYFAHNAIMVKKLGYVDPNNLRRILINEKMVADNEEKTNLELIFDLDKNFSREPDATTIFLDEIEAAMVAEKMNQNQKKNCKKLVDIMNKAYNTYDDIIAACRIK